jgi:hypothetical protein
MMKMLLVILVLSVASTTIVAQESNSTSAPSLTVCKADLKTWSAVKTDTLTIDQIFERMNVMVACGDEAKKANKKDKEVLAYVYEFYRTHSELGNRALDFIKGHDLEAQFRQEANGAAAQSAEKR